MATARPAALLLVASLALTACAGSGETASQPTSTAPPSTASATATTAAATTDPAACEPAEPKGTAVDGTTTVFVHFLCPLGPDARLVAAPRRVAAGDATVRTALELLVKGPTDEERQAGLWSALDRYEDGRLLVGVDVTDGHAVIDFTEQLAEQYAAADATFAERLFATLDSTVFQFPPVNRITYRIAGDAEAVCREFQTRCESRTRQEWEQRPLQDQGVLPGDGDRE